MHVKIAIVQLEIQQFVPKANLKKVERFSRSPDHCLPRGFRRGAAPGPQRVYRP